MLTRPRLPAGIYDTRSPYERLIASHPAPEVPKAPTLMEAFETYVDVDARNLKADTWQQRERSLRALIAHVGGEVRVDQVTRQVASQWATELQKNGLTKRYVANMISHVSQLFDVQIRSGYIPQGQNPIKGLVTLSAADKRLIRSSGRGCEPFQLEDLQKIFAPHNFQRATQQHTRWAALIGLYSGARVSKALESVI